MMHRLRSILLIAALSSIGYGIYLGLCVEDEPPPPLRGAVQARPSRIEPAESIEASIGGPKTPAGVAAQIDLPGQLHAANISSKGLGCCVFRSLDHAARWQHLPALVRMPEWMVQHGIPGGGWPAKVAELVPKICRDRNMPVVSILQAERTDLSLVRAALESGRMVCATYSRSPTGRYGGARIAHMVNIIHVDDQWVGVLDNNYPGREGKENIYEWMTPREAKEAGCLDWVIILLPPGTPPRPHNHEVAP